jgi:hypothetical protein
VYRPVETAYAAVRHVNETLSIRETRSGNPPKMLGVTTEDHLDVAYETAGAALDALGEPRGEPWETAAQRAARLIAEGVLGDETN